MTARDFLRWWGGQLASLLPVRLPGREPHGSRFLLLTLLSSPGSMPATLALDRVSPGDMTPRRELLTIGDADLGALRAVLGRGRTARSRKPGLRLRLPPGVLLECEVVLPLAAESSLEQVLGFELDRLTPFRAADALWSHRVIRRDRTLGRLHLALTLGSREVLAPLLAVLHAAGVSPRLLESLPAEGDGSLEWRRLVLRPRGAARSQAGLRAGTGLAALLALAVVAVPFARQSLTLAALDARQDALRPAMAEAASLRRHMAAVAASAAVVEAERSRLGDPLHALAAITHALPDNTFVTDLSLRQHRLTLSGQSAAAVQLIARLAAEPIIRDPAFSAPVTRAGHDDLFSISAELLP